MKFREQRGGFSESMATITEIPPTKEALVTLLNLRCVVSYTIKDPDCVTVYGYGGVDSRCGWDTHLVVVEGKAVGFTDGPLRLELRVDSPLDYRFPITRVIESNSIREVKEAKDRYFRPTGDMVTGWKMP